MSDPVAETDIQDAAARAAVADLSSYKWGFTSDIEQDFAPGWLIEALNQRENGGLSGSGGSN